MATTNESRLIQAQKEYIEFLGNEIKNNAGFLYAHGLTPSDETVKKGKGLRDRIKRLETN